MEDIYLNVTNGCVRIIHKEKAYGRYGDSPFLDLMQNNKISCMSTDPERDINDGRYRPLTPIEKVLRVNEINQIKEYINALLYPQRN